MKDRFAICEQLRMIIDDMVREKYEPINTDTVLDRFESDIYTDDLLQFAAGEREYMERAIEEQYYCFSPCEYIYVTHIYHAQWLCAYEMVEEVLEEYFK